MRLFIFGFAVLKPVVILTHFNHIANVIVLLRNQVVALEFLLDIALIPRVLEFSFKTINSYSVHSHHAVTKTNLLVQIHDSFFKFPYLAVGQENFVTLDSSVKLP